MFRYVLTCLIALYILTLWGCGDHSLISEEPSAGIVGHVKDTATGGAIEGAVVTTDDPDGPFGAKEASEGSITSMPPAVVNAIHDATGVWLKELPVTPEKVVKALKEKGKPPSGKK